MVRSHYVVTPGPEGEAVVHPLKPWLRENPDQNPPGMHPDENNSHSLRRGLKKLGWRLQFTQSEVLIIKPDQQGSISYADDLINAEEDQYSEYAFVDIEDSAELTFSLEMDLQAALRSNIEKLEAGLRIIDGGKERTTDAGRIDILAEDRDDNLVVIELKAGQANSKVIAQVLAYMSAVADEDERSVRGIIVAGDFCDRVVLAAKAVPNLGLRKYAYQFTFSELE